MQTKFKILSVAFILLINLRFSMAQDVRVPDAWFLLPENAAKNLNKNHSSGAQESELSLAFSKLLTANQQAISHTTFFEEQEKGVLKDWELDRFIFTLGLGLKGTIGLVTLGGHGAFEFHYLPKQEKDLSKLLEEKDLENPWEMNLTHDMTQEEMESQIEKISSLAYSTKKIKSKDRLKQELRKYALEFLDFTVGLSHADFTGEWFVQGYEMILAVEASGKVQPEVNVGGEIRLRLRWRAPESSHPTTKPLTPKQINVKNFITGLAEDLTMVSAKTTFDQYHLTQLELGLGLSAKGTVVVVKAKGSIEGRVILNRRSNIDLTHWRPRHQGEYLVLYDDYKEQTVNYAEANGIEYEVEYSHSNQKKVSRRILYKIGRQRIRAGLERTFKVARFFHKLASTHEMKNWHVGQIKLNYDFSVEGVLPFVTVGGQAVSELTFQKQGGN